MVLNSDFITGPGGTAEVIACAFKEKFAASDYLGRVLSKHAEIVLFHVMAEAPEAFIDVSIDQKLKKKIIRSLFGRPARRKLFMSL